MKVVQTYDNEFISNMFGFVIEKPSKIQIAGSFTTFVFTIQIGRYGLDDGGHVIIAWPVTAAFGKPQFEDPSADNYTEIITSRNVKLDFEFKNSAYIRPHMPCIIIKVWDGSLKEGDSLSIVMGNKDQGSKGIEVQTYVENNIPFKIALDPFGTNLYTELPDQPFIDVVAGVTQNIHIRVKSQAQVGENFWITIRGEDKIGNTSNFVGNVEVISHEASFQQEYELTESHNGWIRIENAVIDKSGIFTLQVSTKDNQMIAKSNPIEILNEKKSLQLYWGDLHGQTGETVGSGTITEYLKFGRDIAALDFISHAANAFQVTNEIWENTQINIKEFHVPNKYITFLGYEWSGVTSAGGDHNVYYLHDDQPIHRCSHALIANKSDLNTDRYPVSELYKEFEGRKDVMIIPHIGGRRATLDVFDEELTPFIEIVSVHGHFQWFADEAMERGLKTGFICSSDTHSGRPGDTFPVTYIEAVPTGLTGVYGEELTRESLWDAFKNRHVYGTTGARIILEFHANEAMMGDEIKAEIIKFRGKVIGTAALERIEIVKNNDVVYSHPMLETKNKVMNKITIRWTGARTQFRRRNSNWSGEISIKNGEFEKVEQIAFDLPWEGITSQDKSSITFVSTTAGDYDILDVTFKGDSSTEIKFSSDIISHNFKPHEILKPVIIEGGLIQQQLEIIPQFEEEYPTTVEFSTEITNETNENRNINAYYLKILQIDGEKAWSSPIFIE